MDLRIIPITKPDDCNFILGQSHFIKSVEDIHEAIVTANPGMKFGLAFSEASGPCLIRLSGNDQQLIDLARSNALALGCGHTFIVFMTGGYPINILNAVKHVPEVCSIFCASANSVQVIVAESDQGRGIAGVIDGTSPQGVETEADVATRKQFLRTIGYKL